jgi:hypothetical protein
MFFLFLLLLGTGLGGFYFFAYRWAFYLGGNFHMVPMWQGVGKVHAKSGNYVFYVVFYPETRDMKTYLTTSLTGTANVCTPRGEDIFLVLGGGMRRHLNVSTDGEEIGLYVHRRSYSGISPQAAPPKLEFRGHCRNPNLVMDDRGTIAKAFLPDGNVETDRNHNNNNFPEVVPITFSAGSVSDYRSAYKAIRK